MTNNHNLISVLVAKYMFNAAAVELYRVCKFVITSLD